MTPYGIGLVARQTISTRLRTWRWKLLLLVWFGVVNGLGLLSALTASGEEAWERYDDAVLVFSGLWLLVLVSVLLIVPAFGGRPAAGERDHGTLAGSMHARPAPGDIMLGRFAAAWGTGVLLLLLALPGAVLGPALDGLEIGRALVAMGMTALMTGVVSALSVALSVLVVRDAAVPLSYFAVCMLLFGTGIAFAMAQRFVPRSPPAIEGSAFDEVHTERIWWLLAPNPAIVVTDAMPRTSDYEVFTFEESAAPDVLAQLGNSARQWRGGSSVPENGPGRVDDVGAVWPYGLAFDLVLAGGALWGATRRLRSRGAHDDPYRREET
ncbi:hypothetical protein [Actinomadura sp. HBU206391]|uniref:hypothetical protein n=1 Tax=Actinomadura sp. HBU206391 TaxID=2731692 RepID=UPI001650B03E|nr:hypothetical protein [Actinomadura sp. HBU206391]MBC6461578.1 hypothetical protein [Actinomadura sp. HBU206391]